MSRQKAETQPTRASGGECANLDRQYRSIGISAVAAALPYRGEGKNPRYAPTGIDEDPVSEADKPSLFSV